MEWISIDLGLNGGIAFWENSELKFVFSMPIENNDYCIRKIAKILKNVNFAVIENVHATPFNGSISSFKLGRALGIFEGILNSNNIEYLLVSPQRWKKDLGILKMKKNEVVKMYNSENNTNFMMKDDGLVESILIGKWYIKFGGKKND